MRFRKLTTAQEECLKNASEQPVGRKGKKWLAWANGVLRAGGLAEVVVLETPVSEPVPPPKVQKSRMRVQNGGQPAQGLQATLQLLEGQKQHSSIQIPRTFVVQSGVLEGPGVSITIEKGILKGYFLESGETRSKANHDGLSLMAAAAAAVKDRQGGAEDKGADRHGSAAAAAGGFKDKGADRHGSAAAAAGGFKDKGADRHGSAAAAAGGDKDRHGGASGGGFKDKAVRAAGGSQDDSAAAASGGSKGGREGAAAAAGGSKGDGLKTRHGAAGSSKRKASVDNGPNKLAKVVNSEEGKENSSDEGKENSSDEDKENSSEEGKENSSDEDKENSSDEDKDDSSEEGKEDSMEGIVEASEELV